MKDAAKDVAKDQAKSKAQEKVQQKIDQKTGKPKRSLRRRIVVDVPRRMPRRRNVVEMRAFQKRYESDVLSFEGMVRRDVWGNVEGFRSF